jgi:hypothetical protein
LSKIVENFGKRQVKSSKIQSHDFDFETCRASLLKRGIFLTVQPLKNGQSDCPFLRILLFKKSFLKYFGHALKNWFKL